MFTSRYVMAGLDARLFPFLADAEKITRSRYGVPPIEVVRRQRHIIEKGVERVIRALKRLRVPQPSENADEEVLAFYVAAVLVHYSGSRWAVSRLALAEAERAYEFLLNLADEAVAGVARVVGLRSLSFSPRAYSEPIAVVGFTPIYRVYGFSVSLVEYVKYGRRLLGDDAWKPINLPVKGGIVYLDKQRAVRLIKEAMTEFIEKRIEEIGQTVGMFPPELEEQLSRVREAAAEVTRRPVAGREPHIPRGVIVEEAFPPCMKDIYERARRGEHLSHHERFAIATFLLNIGADIDTVVDVFRNMPDFKEKITRYQVEHLAGLRGSGKKYSTYSCEKMRTLGLCRAECGTKTPIQSYYRNLRMSARKGERKEQTHK